MVAVLGTASDTGDWFLSGFALFHKAFGGYANPKYGCHAFLIFCSMYGIATRSEPRWQAVRNRTPYCIRQTFRRLLSCVYAGIFGEEVLAVNYSRGPTRRAWGADTGDHYRSWPIRHWLCLVGRGSNGSNIMVSRESVEACLASSSAGIEVTIINFACHSGLWAVPFPK